MIVNPSSSLLLEVIFAEELFLISFITSPPFPITWPLSSLGTCRYSLSIVLSGFVTTVWNYHLKILKNGFAPWAVSNLKSTLGSNQLCQSCNRKCSVFMFFKWKIFFDHGNLKFCSRIVCKSNTCICTASFPISYCKCGVQHIEDFQYFSIRVEEI